MLVAVGQENAFPWIERDIGLEFDRFGLPKLDPTTLRSSLPNVFFGGDSAFGPKNIIWAVAHGHEAAVSIHRFCEGEDVSVRPPPAITALVCRSTHSESEMMLARSPGGRALPAAPQLAAKVLHISRLR